MPRGKNYVNNNRGVFLKPSKKKGSANMEACFFGAGCTRKDCIYRHDREAMANNAQSEEPCMAYLAGYCAFNARSCRKRHPPPAEAERLKEKYSQIRCRYGSQCQTQGCLYQHEARSEPVHLTWMTTDLEANDSSTKIAPPPPLFQPMAVPGTSWRPTPPAGPPRPLSQQPSSFQQHPPNNSYIQTRPVPPTRPPQRPPFSMQQQQQQQSSSPGQYHHLYQPPSPPTDASGGFNINAREFVPGGGGF